MMPADSMSTAPGVPTTAPATTATATTAPATTAPATTGSYDGQLAQALAAFLGDPDARMTIPHDGAPAVSVVVVAWNKAPVTLLSLASLVASAGLAFELIVVDNGSDDELPELLSRLDGAEVIRHTSNEGFIKAANAGAAEASCRHLLFLNNDAMVTPGSLPLMVRTLDEYPGAGAVGAKLVWPTGRLQEAGSIIWRDGSAQAYGRGDDPQQPAYCYLREVDYCSGAALLVDRSLFTSLGGFDEGYGIAYYEDADLCMGVWASGRKVVYQPKSIIIHHEFTTSTPALAHDLCQLNRPRFAQKWREQLASRWPASPQNVLFARDRRRSDSLLMFDDRVPTAEQGCGYARSQVMVDTIASSGLKMTFVPLVDQVLWPEPTDRLTQAGVEVMLPPPEGLAAFLDSRRGYYRSVLVSRPHNAELVMELLGTHLPEALVLYDAEAVYYRREVMGAEVMGMALDPAGVEEMRSHELALMQDADAVISVSDDEAGLIRSGCDAEMPVFTWGFAHEVHEPANPFEERRDVLFVGSFLRGHEPNRDAVRHFAMDLLPSVRDQLGDCRFIVVGASPTEDVLELASPEVVVTGFVEDLSIYYESCRLVVVPLRFGAGINYKVTEAMSYGVPVVASPVAAEGLGALDGEEIVVAQDDEAFIDAVVRSYRDEDMWYRIQAGELDYVRRNCDPALVRQRLLEIIHAVIPGGPVPLPPL